MIPNGKDEFVARFGHVYQQASWIAADSWPACMIAHSAEQLAAIMAATLDSAPRHDKLSVIRAHPDFIARLTQSAGSQRGNETDLTQIRSLNRAYTEKFQFPFVLAAQGADFKGISHAFARRLENTLDQEFAAALREIHKIARDRLEQLF